MKIVVQLIDEAVDIDKLTYDDIVQLLNRHTCQTLTHKELEYANKKLLDHLIENYGHLGSLVRLMNFKVATDVFYNNYDNSKRAFNIYLMRAAARILYDRIEEYYLVDVLYKMLLAFRQIKTRTFDAATFLSRVSIETITFPIEDDEEQLLMPGFTRQVSLNALGEACQAKSSSTNLILKKIKEEFTTCEINDYAMQLVDILSVEENPVNDTIIKTLLEAMKSLTKFSKSKHTNNPNQLTITPMTT